MKLSILFYDLTEEEIRLLRMNRAAETYPNVKKGTELLAPVSKTIRFMHSEFFPTIVEDPVNYDSTIYIPDSVLPKIVRITHV